MNNKKAAVIGAGLGGLSTAIRLANNGVKVDVYERNSLPGGKANLLKANGFTFDTGPSLLTMPFVLEELFKESGKSLSDYIKLEKLDIICKYFFKDGTVINAYSDIEKFGEEIEQKTADKKENIFTYLDYSKNIYDRTADLFLYKNPSHLSTYFSTKALNTLIHLNEIDPCRSMHEANAAAFKDPKTIQLFDRYATYNGSNPYLAPATLNIIQHVEYNMGSYIASEGIYSITDGMFKLAKEKGVNFLFDTEVSSIYNVNKRASGVVVNNDLIRYDHIISNVDVNYTYKHLLKETDSESSKKYRGMEPSSSGLVFYWGIKGLNKNLGIHNVLFSNDYFKEFHEIFGLKKCPHDPTVYIYISSNFNKSHAPKDHENWFVMINTPYTHGQNWDEEIKRSRNIILKKIEDLLKINLNGKIVFENILSPEMIEAKTSSFKGSIYGISSNTKYAAFLRHPNKSRNIKGLYFCGGSAHPGGGIPLVILSGKFAAEEVFKRI